MNLTLCLLICQLYDHFLLGFPFDWEEYAAVVTGEDSTDIVASMRNSAYKKFNVSSGTNESNSLPFSLDDLPVTRARDLSMLSFGDSDYCSLVKSIFSDILKTSRDNASGHTGSPIGLNMENRSPVPNVDSGTTETPAKHKKVKVKEDKNLMTEENKKICKIRPSCSVGVLTRSMTRRSMTGNVFHKKNDKKEDYTKTHDQKKVVAHQLFRQTQRRNKEKKSKGETQ